MVARLHYPLNTPTIIELHTLNGRILLYVNYISQSNHLKSVPWILSLFCSKSSQGAPISSDPHPEDSYHTTGPQGTWPPVLSSAQSHWPPRCAQGVPACSSCCPVISLMAKLFPGALLLSPLVCITLSWRLPSPCRLTIPPSGPPHHAPPPLYYLTSYMIYFLNYIYCLDLC